MKMILKGHNGIDTVNKAFSFMTNFETVMGKSINDIVAGYNGYPCFKKISNDGMFELLVSLGKVTQSFISYYDGVEKISKRKLFSLEALYKELLKQGKTKDEANNILKYFLSLYILENEEARKEFFFMMYYTNKQLSSKNNIFMAEILPVEDSIEKYILCKDEPDEDGSIPVPSLKGMSLLEAISAKTITLDFGMQKKIAGIIEDQVNMSTDDEAIKAFLAIADLLQLDICE